MPMMTASWYDQIFRELSEYHKLYKESRYYLVWQMVLSMIKPGDAILDLGCGTGQFAQMCRDLGYPYIGVDFSGEALRQARIVNPETVFIQADINRLDSLPIDYREIGTVTFIEVLEHLEEDIKALMFYGRDKPVVLTVPAFMTEGHVRCFENSKQITDRFNQFVFDQIVPIEKSRIFVCRAHLQDHVILHQ